MKAHGMKHVAEVINAKVGILEIKQKSQICANAQSKNNLSHFVIIRTRAGYIASCQIIHRSSETNQKHEPGIPAHVKNAAGNKKAKLLRYGRWRKPVDRKNY